MWSLDSAFQVSIVDELGLLLGSQQLHVGLEQQAEPVAAVRTHDRGVVLVAELGPLAVDGDDGLAGELAGLPVPGEHPVNRLPARRLGVS